MSDDSNTATGGIGFFGLLSILFIGLKLTDVIDWSWWWVLAPIWIPWSILGVLGLIALIVWVVSKWSAS